MHLIKSPRSLLLTAPHNLGDWVAKLPFIRLFKNHFPTCHIIVLGRSYIKPLVSLFNEVDEFIDFEQFFKREENDIIQSLKDMNIEVCLHVLGVSKQIGPDVLGYARCAGIPYRIGNIFRSKWTLFKKRGMGLTHNLRCPRVLPHMHEFEWNLQPLQFFEVKVPQKPVNWKKLLHCSLKRKECSVLQKGKINLILHPGSHGHAKEWPLSFFKSLIKKLAGKAHILVTGSEKEKQRQPLEDISDFCTDLRGQMDLMDFLQLIAQANGLIAGSTGPIHLASLFDTPICALFPKQLDISEKIWGPKSEFATVLSAPSICLACQRKLSDFNEELCTCMEGVSVDKVYDAIQHWLNYENTLR